jgi:hypothetical protein
MGVHVPIIEGNLDMNDSPSIRVVRALNTLLKELVDGAARDSAWVLNRGDSGLLASLDVLSAEAASASPDGRASIACHVAHLRYGLELLNRWTDDHDPFDSADYSVSWRRGRVSIEEWRTLRMALAREAHAWVDAVAQPRIWNDQTMTGALASAVHLAYHLGAIRQIDRTAKGPADSGVTAGAEV